ncbi:MBL fold metallo-hydrolase [Klebsiella pneumoniae]
MSLFSFRPEPYHKRKLPFLKLQELLGERKIKYILISHFESDECGGLALVLKEHPEAVAVCSETTARQLMGFGITNNVLIKKPNEIFAGDDFEFQTISYPSEMHMWKDFYFLKRNVVFSLGKVRISRSFLPKLTR